jgi:phage baseplate assembly protein W
VTASDFIGRGWDFPMRVDARGGIATTGGSEEIDAALRMILSSAPGERVMRPDFGCAIWDLVFDSADANTLGLMALAVREAVGRWEPRVDLLSVSPHTDPADPARVLIGLTYLVKTTNDLRNLVFPFYVIPKEVEP